MAKITDLHTNYSLNRLILKPYHFGAQAHFLQGPGAAAAAVPERVSKPQFRELDPKGSTTERAT